MWGSEAITWNRRTEQWSLKGSGSPYLLISYADGRETHLELFDVDSFGAGAIVIQSVISKVFV